MNKAESDDFSKKTLYKPLYFYDRLHPESILSEGLALMSKNQAYFAFVSPQGQLTVYVSGHFVPSNIIWCSKNKATDGKNPYSLLLQKDGNLIISNNKEERIWQSNTSLQGKSPYQLIMQDDGNLVIYDALGSPIWCVGMINR